MKRIVYLSDSNNIVYFLIVYLKKKVEVDEDSERIRSFNAEVPNYTFNLNSRPVIF